MLKPFPKQKCNEIFCLFLVIKSQSSRKKYCVHVFSFLTHIIERTYNTTKAEITPLFLLFPSVSKKIKMFVLLQNRLGVTTYYILFILYIYSQIDLYLEEKVLTENSHTINVYNTNYYVLKILNNIFQQDLLRSFIFIC